METPENRLPTRFAATIFNSKARLLQLRRASFDVAGGIRRHPHGALASFPFVIAESRTPLWDADNGTERELQWGKVQNLRCALRRLHQTQLPAGEVFSFWKQIGQATRRRGYVAGRLLREGCLMPAVGGGLCQLSNALYEVALQAELEIAERYAHSRIVPGSAAESGRDATVAWNYLDLRFRSAQPILIEAQLTADELVVRLRARNNANRASLFVPALTSSPPNSLLLLDVNAHSCASCAQTSCFRHRPTNATYWGRTAYLVDELWPEFQQYLDRVHEADAVLGVPFPGRVGGRYGWQTDGYARVKAAAWPALKRSQTTRRQRAHGAARLQAQIQGAAQIAKRFGGRLERGRDARLRGAIAAAVSVARRSFGRATFRSFDDALAVASFAATFGQRANNTSRTHHVGRISRASLACRSRKRRSVGSRRYHHATQRNRRFISRQSHPARLVFARICRKFNRDTARQNSQHRVSRPDGGAQGCLRTACPCARAGFGNRFAGQRIGKRKFLGRRAHSPSPRGRKLA